MARARGNGELEPRRPDPLPWERQKGESARAYSYFCEYRNLGPQRSIAKVAAMTRIATRTLEEHSSKWRWVERADAYWEWWERRTREEMETERSRIQRAHLGLGAQLLVVAQTRLTGRRAALVEGGPHDGQEIPEVAALNPADLDPLDVARFAKVGVEIQRASAGLGTGIGATAVTASDAVQMARDLVEIALEEIDPARQPRYMAKVEAYFEAGRR